MRDGTTPTAAPLLPEDLAWDLPAGWTLQRRHQGFAIDRIMARGSLEQIRELRLAVGDEALAARLRETAGRGLPRRRLRLFEVLLVIPRDQVDAWLADPRRKVWDER
jgi:hypothetical protein